MSTAALKQPTAKFHASLNVSDLAASTTFYRVLFGQEPAKQKRDYVKFELEQPPVVLALNPGCAGTGGNLNHVGWRVPNSEMLVEIQARLEAAGLRTTREEGVECCYAQQTKFWVTDPDRTLWEIYVLHEGDEEEAGHQHSEIVDRPNAFANDSAPATRRTWQHHLTDGTPVSVPHDNNSLHEILLEGSANLHPGRCDFAQFVKDAYQALRPGGEVRIHGLTADASLKNASPALPGPAAAVQYVPTHSEVANHLKLAGFVSIQFERLSEKAHFTSEGISMRELMLVGYKPGHRAPVAIHTFRGPVR